MLRPSLNQLLLDLEPTLLFCLLLADRQASCNYRHPTFLGYPDSSLLQLVIAEPDQTVILGDRQAVIAKICNPDGHLAAANRNDIMLLQVLLHRCQLSMEDDLCPFPLNPFRPLRFQLLETPRLSLNNQLVIVLEILQVAYAQMSLAELNIGRFLMLWLVELKYGILDFESPHTREQVLAAYVPLGARLTFCRRRNPSHSQQFLLQRIDAPEQTLLAFLRQFSASYLSVSTALGVPLLFVDGNDQPPEHAPPALVGPGLEQRTSWPIGTLSRWSSSLLAARATPAPAAAGVQLVYMNRCNILAGGDHLALPQ